METDSSSNKRIAKNTLFLYFRLLFTLTIGLYTARVVLNVLGVVDYGIYNVVGGVVAVFTFMHGALSSATTRFINVTMVEDLKKVKTVFNTSLIMHFALAIIVLILAETVGLWFLYNKLIIPEDRFNVSLIVYQFSIISVFISIIQIPYDAAIIANEKMSMYAYLSIIEACMKLLIVYSVKVLPYDNLFSYGLLILILSVITRFIYQRYCRRNFKETHFSFLFDKGVFKKMISFFGWDLYGNMSMVFSLQGVNILQNVFFGPIVNASVAIVSQAQGGLMALGYNFNLAAKPQMMQSYSKKDFSRMFNLLSQGTRMVFLLMILVALPLVFHSKYILQLWLGEVPVYADMFLQLSLISSIIGMSFSLLTPIIHATGKMFRVSFFTGTIYLISLPITYFLFKAGYNPLVPYYLNLILVVFAGIINLYTIEKYVPSFKVKSFFYNVLFRLYLVFLISLIIGYTISKLNTIHSFVAILITYSLTLLCVLFIGLQKNDLKRISGIIMSRIFK